MPHFIINGFDFGIDPTASEFRADGVTLDIKIVGSKVIMDEIMEADDHPWSWLLYPPFIFFRGLPYQPTTTGDFKRDISDNDLDEYDIALYATEHCDVLPCSLVRIGNLLKIFGQVHQIEAHALDFDVEYDVP
jgi:hypothetical protein